MSILTERKSLKIGTIWCRRW